jgi:hypothetical protein
MEAKVPCNQDSIVSIVLKPWWLLILGDKFTAASLLARLIDQSAPSVGLIA